MAGRSKSEDKATKDPAASRAKRGATVPTGDPSKGRVAEYLQRVVASFGDVTVDLDPQVIMQIALYEMTAPECTPGLKSAFLRIALDARKHAFAEKQTLGGIEKPEYHIHMESPVPAVADAEG